MIKNKRSNISQKNTKMYTKPSSRSDTVYTKMGKNRITSRFSES